MHPNRFFCFILCFLLLVSLLPGCLSEKKNGRRLNIAAAASLNDALEAIKLAYQEKHPGLIITIIYGSSGSLRQQIEQGAGIDLFLSADPVHIFELEKQGFLLEGSKKVFAENRLVLIKPKGSPIQISGLKDLKHIRGKKVAMGDPASVPAGRYAKESLIRAGVWNEVQGHLVFGKDVSQVLTYVETGNADLGLVYESDLHRIQKIERLASIPPSLHSPIVYVGGILKESPGQKEAADFLQFLLSPPSQQILEKHGFVIPGNLNRQGSG